MIEYVIKEAITEMIQKAIEIKLTEAGVTAAQPDRL
jgi:hypothetical protein